MFVYHIPLSACSMSYCRWHRREDSQRERVLDVQPVLQRVSQSLWEEQAAVCTAAVRTYLAGPGTRGHSRVDVPALRWLTDQGKSYRSKARSSFILIIGHLNSHFTDVVNIYHNFIRKEITLYVLRLKFVFILMRKLLNIVKHTQKIYQETLSAKL